MSRGFSAMSITIVGNFWVSDGEALFEIGQRDAVALGGVGVGGVVVAELICCSGVAGTGRAVALEPPAEPVAAALVS